MRRGDGTQSQERREILRSQERITADTRFERKKNRRRNKVKKAKYREEEKEVIKNEYYKGRQLNKLFAKLT